MLKPRMYTVEDFYLLVEDGQKADLIDGVIYLASPDTEISDDLNSFLLTLLRTYTRQRTGGRVSGSRFCYRLGPHNAPEPDVAWVSARRLKAIVKPKGGFGPPDLAIEIVARDSRSRDYVKKRRLYETSGVSEYWIIDPLKDHYEFLYLVEGVYRPIPIEGGVVRSHVVPGFWLDVVWLQSRPLPLESDCLRQILG